MVCEAWLLHKGLPFALLLLAFGRNLSLAHVKSKALIGHTWQRHLCFWSNWDSAGSNWKYLFSLNVGRGHVFTTRLGDAKRVAFYLILSDLEQNISASAIDMYWLCCEWHVYLMARLTAGQANKLKIRNYIEAWKSNANWMRSLYKHVNKVKWLSLY